MANEGELGLKQDTDIIVSRSVSHSVKEVWKALASHEGAEALLGPGGELGDKGDDWRANDGTFGVIRSYHALEEVRFTWHAAEGAPRTTVTVHLGAAADGATMVEIRHVGVPSYFDKTALEKRWETFLEKLLALADRPA